ncbi:MAG TPA: GerMN domain-containing protein [Silvibacterium sp.]|nr:GerMN domain-containing protein [Silvibacterium sp.]
MISRVQRILFFAMLVAAVVMAAVLIRLRERAADRMRAVQGPAELTETVDAPATPVTLLIPNDADNSLTESQRSLRLPQDDSSRARVLLETLLETFREPHSTHPIGGSSANPGSKAIPGTNIARSPDIDEVYLMPVPQTGSQKNAGKMAVVNFSAAFAQSHPSGIEPETLTLLAVIGTLHSNLRSITQVRFLVDGRQQDTLAGHADLTRVYLASDTGAPGGG